MDVTVGLHYLILSHLLLLIVTFCVTIRLLNPRRFNHKFSLKSGEKSTRTTAFLKLDKIHEHLPENERSFVVFLSGFRVHSWTKIIISQLKALLKFNRYTGIVLKPKDRMPNYEDGCIGSFKYGSLLGDVVMIQYWRSFDHLTVRVESSSLLFVCVKVFAQVQSLQRHCVEAERYYALQYTCSSLLFVSAEL